MSTGKDQPEGRYVPRLIDTRVRDPVGKLRRLMRDEAWTVMPGRLKEARVGKGLKQSDLATAAGVARETISRLENARVTTSFSLVSRLSVALECSALWLIGFDEVDEVVPAAEVSERVRAFAESEPGAALSPSDYELRVLSALPLSDNDRSVAATLEGWRAEVGRDPRSGGATDRPPFPTARGLSVSILMPDGRIERQFCTTDRIEALLWNAGADHILILSHRVRTDDEWECAQPVKQLRLSAEEKLAWARRREAAEGQKRREDEGGDEGGPEE